MCNHFQLFQNFEFICCKLERTHFASLDNMRCALVWDYVFSFPIKIKDLSRDAALVLTVWTENSGPYGGTTMPLFDTKVNYNCSCYIDD